MKPPGPELARSNRRILAERLHWPAGALEECERIDADFDGWYTSWRHPYRDRPAGYSTYHDEWHREPHLFAQTPEELRELISAHRCPTAWAPFF